jgi:hypothetical protein
VDENFLSAKTTSLILKSIVVHHPMPLIYGDSFQDDEDLVNIFAALRVSDQLSANPTPQTPARSSPTRSPTMPVTATPSTRALAPILQHQTQTQQDESDSTPSAGRAQSQMLDQSQMTDVRTPGKCFFVIPGISSVFKAVMFDLAAPVLPAPAPAPVVRIPTSVPQENLYNVYSGKRTGVRNTWHAIASQF